MYHIDDAPQDAAWKNLDDPLRQVANAKNLICMYAGEAFLSQRKGIDPATSDRPGDLARYDLIAEAYRNVNAFQDDLDVSNVTVAPILAGKVLLEVDLKEADTDG